jgi:HD-like signal output (HDOD) protein
VAFTAGLLHDIGTLVLVTYHSAEYEHVIAWQTEHQCTQFDAEREILGIDHAAVGEELAIYWNFSDQMKNAIAGHHQPDKPGLGFLATIVHVANGIAHVLNVTESADHTTPKSPRYRGTASGWIRKRWIRCCKKPVTNLTN